MHMSGLIISATKPQGKPAVILGAMGITILPIQEDEGNVDRYVLSKRVAVERRTGAAFLAGIMDKTLFTSAIWLREHFRIPILIVEGEVDYEFSNFNPQAVRGALTAMMLEYGVNVLSTPDLDETVALIAMLARQEQLGIPEISLVPKRKAVDLADQQRRLVEMLPGCGRVAARDLLQRFGSVERIVKATEAELLAQRGLGARKVKEIGRVLHDEYESVDTERDLEDAVEAHPRLLFRNRVTLLARQHHIYSDEKDRHVVDLVFLAKKGSGSFSAKPQGREVGAERHPEGRPEKRTPTPFSAEVILVELKRGPIAPEHCEQIRRYLDRAAESRLLRPLIEAGAAMRGILATVEPDGCEPEDSDITVRVIDRRKVIAVLKRLRRKRLGEK